MRAHSGAIGYSLYQARSPLPEGVLIRGSDRLAAKPWVRSFENSEAKPAPIGGGPLCLLGYVTAKQRLLLVWGCEVATRQAEFARHHCAHVRRYGHAK